MSVTKQRDPKRQAAGRKGHEKYMAKLKEDILKNIGSSNGGSSSSNTTNDSANGGISTTNDSTNGGINTTTDSTTTTSSGSTITYIHSVGAIAVLALGVCVFIKLMRNPSQHDKDSEKISKGPEKISKIRRKML